MTWARVLATGSGKLRWRVAFEGWPYGFVTDAAMERTTAGVEYVVGLEGSSIVIEESVDLAYATLDVAGMSLRIVDVDLNATRAFSTKPTKRAWLTTDIPSTGSPLTMVVTSTEGWATSDYVHIDTEAFDVTVVVDGTQLTATRAAMNSIAQKHFANDGDLLRSAVATDRPQTLEGRRAWIYAYGEGDSATGDGTQVWVGVCASDARLEDGTTWEVSIDPITRLWKTDLGHDLENPVSPRGITYNHTAPLRIAAIEHSSTTYASATSSTAFAEVGVPTLGFYENQTAFLAALNSDLATMDATWTAGNTIRAVEDEDGGWRLVVSLGATPRYFTVLGGSPIDGQTDSFLWDATGSRILTVATGAYNVRWDPGSGPPGARQVPRGMVGPAPSWWTSGHLAGELRRVYLGGDIAVGTSLDGAAIRWGDDGTEQTYSIADADVDATNRYVQLEQVGIVSSPQWHIWTPALLPEIKFARSYVSAGDVSDLRDALVTTGPDTANKGGGPLLSATYDHASWTAVAAEAAAASLRPAFLVNRRYYYTQPVSLEEVFTHEFRLLGVYPCLTASGLIQIRRLALSTPDDVASATIDGSDVLVDGGWPGWERGPLGSINTVSFAPRWSPMSDKFDGSPITIIDASAYGMTRQPRVLPIKPKSQCIATLGGSTAGIVVSAPYEAIAAQASVVLGIFGSPYAVGRVDVPFSLFAVLCGQTVTLTNAQLPDWAGARGLTSVQALVIGRRWSVEEGGGTLTLLLHGLDIAGYAPTARVTAQANVAGNQWDLTIGAAWYMPTGSVLSDFWAAGDLVQIQRWDSATLSTLTGTVDSVTDAGPTLRVTFTGAWTPSTFTWDLMFRDANTSLQAGQKTYAFVADTAARIQFTTTQAARQYAP